MAWVKGKHLMDKGCLPSQEGGLILNLNRKSSPLCVAHHLTLLCNRGWLQKTPLFGPPICHSCHNLYLILLNNSTALEVQYACSVKIKGYRLAALTQVEFDYVDCSWHNQKLPFACFFNVHVFTFFLFKGREAHSLWNKDRKDRNMTFDSAESQRLVQTQPFYLQPTFFLCFYFIAVNNNRLMQSIIHCLSSHQWCRSTSFTMDDVQSPCGTNNPTDMSGLNSCRMTTLSPCH